MKKYYSIIRNLFLLLFLLNFSVQETKSCSSFKLQKGGKLVYGHNLNEGDIGVPGMIFINKRGVFKLGRTLSELTKKNMDNPSSHQWISRYGSVTFNVFGRDLPDGGMNEVGLFIWEMNEDADYPKNNALPKLNQMSWMQYALDNFMTIEEVIKSASEIEIDGWGWHFFVGDKDGNTAAIAFINGEVVVYKNAEMPVPGLFNTPYQREMELLQYFKGYGGNYNINLDDSNIPRFAKVAKLIDDYNPSENIVDYGLMMLDKIQVSDIPEWSILYDANDRKIYFRTRINPSVKFLDLNKIDFSNENPTQIVNMDIKQEGDVIQNFIDFSSPKMSEFIEQLFSLLPKEFFTRGGITMEEYKKRFSTHTDKYNEIANSKLKGLWSTKKSESVPKFTIELNLNGNSVKGSISNEQNTYKIEHLSLIGDKLSFTFKTKIGVIIKMFALVEDLQMNVSMHGIEDLYGEYIFYKMQE